MPPGAAVLFGPDLARRTKAAVEKVEKLRPPGPPTKQGPGVGPVPMVQWVQVTDLAAVGGRYHGRLEIYDSAEQTVELDSASDIWIALDWFPLLGVSYPARRVGDAAADGDDDAKATYRVLDQEPVGLVRSVRAYTEELPAYTRTDNTLLGDDDAIDPALMHGVELVIGDRFLHNRDGDPGIPPVAGDVADGHADNGTYELVDFLTLEDDPDYFDSWDSDGVGTDSWDDDGVGTDKWSDVDERWAAERTPDADTSPKILPGMIVIVTEGDGVAGTGFMLQTDAAITLNTTSLTFASCTVNRWNQVLGAGRKTVEAAAVRSVAATSGIFLSEAGLDGTTPSANHLSISASNYANDPDEPDEPGGDCVVCVKGRYEQTGGRIDIDALGSKVSFGGTSTQPGWYGWMGSESLQCIFRVVPAGPANGRYVFGGLGSWCVSIEDGAGTFNGIDSNILGLLFHGGILYDDSGFSGYLTAFIESVLSAHSLI